MPLPPIPEKGRLRFFLQPRHWHRWLGLAFMWVVNLLPLPLMWICGALVGELLYVVHRNRRHVAHVNIRKCFPDLSPGEQRRLVKQHFRMFGQTLLDMGIAWWAPPTRLKKLIRFDGRDHYERALASGKNVILLVPHFLGLELGVVRLSQERPLCAVFRPVDNEVMRFIMERGRTRFGLTLVQYNKPLITLVRKVRTGVPLYYLPDQAARRRNAAFVPFFGILTATFAVLGRLAKLTDAVVIPCVCRQLPRGAGYEIMFRPPLRDFPTDDPATDAARMNMEIERIVREMPEQYFWMHKRFKARPAGEPSFYS